MTARAEAPGLKRGQALRADAITLTYAWDEDDSPAYTQANRRFWKVFREAGREGQRQAVSGLAYNTYQFGPATVSALLLALWFFLVPEARPPNPMPTIVAGLAAVLAGQWLAWRVCGWMAGPQVDGVRQAFDVLKGRSHSLMMDDAGFTLHARDSDARFSRRAGVLPVETWGQHLLVLHPFMTLVIPARAADRPIAELALRVTRWRDAAGLRAETT